MTDQTPIQQCTEAVFNGDLKTMRSLLVSHRNFDSDPGYINWLLVKAAKRDHLQMVQELVRLGANIHASQSEPGDSDALFHAAGEGAVNVVRWLIDQGAQVNYSIEGNIRCLPLSIAASEGHLEVVKVLLEKGADVNAVWKGRNALKAAIEDGRTEIAAYLRSKGAKTPEELGVAETSASRAAGSLLDHVAQHLGEPEPLSLREIVPTDLPIAIHVIRTEDELILVTEGMSARPMTVPAGGGGFWVCEGGWRAPGGRLRGRAPGAAVQRRGGVIAPTWRGAFRK